VDSTVLLDLIASYGPGLLFLMAILETCFVTGLVVPSGVATSVATVLAGQGVLSYQEVGLAAVCGAWAGDSIGYWVGRRWGLRLLPSRGRFGAAVRRAHERSSRFFGRHPFYSVTVARLVSFVRTLMPMGAGSSGLSYRRYLTFELPGVITWAAMYMAAGALAGESWEKVTQLMGAGWVVIFAAAGLALWVLHRRRRST
jgi:membrane protein DedA with SNARE-associated domain